MKRKNPILFPWQKAIKKGPEMHQRASKIQNFTGPLSGPRTPRRGFATVHRPHIFKHPPSQNPAYATGYNGTI